MVQDVRVARNLRQVDVAVGAGITRQMISRLERGLLDGMTVGSLRAISRAMGMPSIVSLGWRSPEVDRLRDRLHAAMVEQVVSMLAPLGWEMAPERSFNYYGERGSTDILAWHAASGALLVVETRPGSGICKRRLSRWTASGDFCPDWRSASLVGGQARSAWCSSCQR